MLRTDTVYAVQSLSDKLQRNNISLSPMGGTPLAALVNACHNPLDYQIASADPATVLHNLPERLNAMSMERGIDGVVNHDEVMRELVELVSTTVGTSIDRARNVVSPKIKEVVDQVTSRMEADVVSDLMPVTVIPDFHKAIWDSPILAGMVEKFAGIPIETVKLGFNLPSKTEDEVIALLKTGSERFDLEIHEFVREITPSHVHALYQTFFAGELLTDRSLADAINVYTSPRDDILVIYLLAHRLYHDVPEGVTVSLSAYRESLVTLMAQSARSIAGVSAMRLRDVQQKKLIVRYPTESIDRAVPGQTFITVNGVVYNEWLNEGGSIEVLLGSYVTEKELGYRALLENAEFYSKAWERHQRLFKMHLNAQTYNRIVSAFRHVLSIQISSLGADDHPVGKAVLQEKLTEVLSMVKESDTKDIQLLARKLVCRVLFAHTDAEKILNRVDQYAIANPTIDIREAALLAVVDIVAEWVTKLMVVESTV